MKKSLFAKLLIVILCLSLVLCGCSKSEGESGENGENGKNNASSMPDTPEEVADTSLGRTLSAMFGAKGDLGLLSKKMDYSKVTVSVGEYVDNVLYIDSNNMKVVDELTLNLDEMEVEAGIYLDKNDLVVTLPGLVDGAYGISLDTLAEDLENSELLALLGIDYDDLEEELGVAMDQIVDLMEQMESYTSDMEDALESALANIDKDVVEGKVTVDGQEVDAIIVTYSLDSEGLLNMIDELSTWYTDYLEKVSSDLGLDVGMDEVTGELDSVMGEVEDALSEVDLNAKLVVNVNAETGYIMTVEGELEGTAEGETASITLDIDFGVNAAESDKYTLTVGAVEDGEEMDVLQMVLKRDITDAEVNYDLTLKAAGVELASATLNYVKDSGEYEIALEADGSEFSVNGIYKLTNKSFELSVDSINMDGEKTDIDVKILVEKVSANSIPKTPSYENILKMSQDDIVEFVNELSDVVNQFYYDDSYGSYDDIYGSYDDIYDSYEDWDDYDEDWDDSYEDWYDYDI